MTDGWFSSPYKGCQGFFFLILCNICILTNSCYYGFTNKCNLMLCLTSSGTAQLKHYNYCCVLTMPSIPICLLYGYHWHITYTIPTFISFPWNRRHEVAMADKRPRNSLDENTLPIPTFFSSLALSISMCWAITLQPSSFWSML